MSGNLDSILLRNAERFLRACDDCQAKLPAEDWTEVQKRCIERRIKELWNEPEEQDASATSQEITAEKARAGKYADR